jgi:hypothetical protein
MTDQKTNSTPQPLVEKVEKVEKKDKVLFAVDIEGSGSSFGQNGIVAIGWCVGDLHGRVLEKKRVSLKLHRRTFEPRCLTEYWSKPAQAAQLAVFQSEALEPAAAMKIFIDAVDSFESRYDLVILTDNPSYDIAWLNYYLDHYLGRSPLNYMKDQTTYRGVRDVFQFAFYRKMKQAEAGGQGKWFFDMEKYKAGLDKLKEANLHDHWPENDAEYIFRKTILLDSI